MAKFIPVEPEKWAEMVKAQAEVARLEHLVNYWKVEAETDNARWLRVLEENDRLKAEVERLTKAVKFNFPGGDQLLADLSKLLTAHRHYCDVNAIDYSKMEKDALNAAKKGGQP